MAECTRTTGCTCPLCNKSAAALADATPVCARATADYQEAIEQYRRIYADNYDDTEKPKIDCTAGMDGAWMY